MTLAPDPDSTRRDLLDALHDALDEYESGGADFSALVHDAHSVIVELARLSDPTGLERMLPPLDS
jgi:hypothetical protein